MIERAKSSGVRAAQRRRASRPIAADAADAVRLRPAPVARAPRAGRGVSGLARRASPRGRCAVRARATCSTSGSATTSCATRWRPMLPPRWPASADAGVRVYLQRGNRDFLLGERFARAAGAILLPDAIVRPSAWHAYAADARRSALHRRLEIPALPRVVGGSRSTGAASSALPWFARRGIGAMLRAASRRANRGKTETIMDVSNDAVAAALREHGVSRLIHGHTHRPARHEHRRRRCAARAPGARRLVRPRAATSSVDEQGAEARSYEAAAAESAAASAQRLREVGDQVVAVLDADRKADQRVGDAHRSRGAPAPFRRRSCARPESPASGCRRGSTTSTTHLQAIQKIEAVERRIELERQQCAVSRRTVRPPAACCGCEASPG